MSYTINESNQERQGLLGNNYNRLAAKYFAQLKLPINSRILDLGCGQGEATRQLHQTFAPERCIGVDMDNALLDIARSKNAPAANSIIEGSAGPEYQPGNAKELPFEDNYFDFVYARLLLLHVPSWEAVLKEMTRTCKPGGVVMVQDLIIPETVGLYPKHWTYEKSNQAMRELFANPDIGLELPLKFKKHGLENMAIRSDIFLLHEKGKAKKLMTQTAEGMMDGMVGKGILKQEDVPVFIEEMKAIEADNSYVFLTNPFVTVWGNVG